jgi:hypothetical protein
VTETQSDIPFQILEKIIAAHHFVHPSETKETISFFMLITFDCFTHSAQEISSSPRHTPPPVIIEYLFRYHKTLLSLLLERRPPHPFSSPSSPLPPSSSLIELGTNCLLDGFSQVALSIKNLILTMEILRWNQMEMEQQQTHKERTTFLLRYLQTLYAPNGKLYPVIQQVESLLGSREGIEKVVLFCRDTSDDSVLYDSNGSPAAVAGAGAASSANGRVSSPSRGQSRSSDVRSGCEYSFQVYEITGTVSLEFSNKVGTRIGLDDLDEKMFEVLTSITGRRIYELYRGKRNKRVLVTLQREIEMYKYEITSLTPSLSLTPIPPLLFSLLSERFSQRKESKSRTS